MTPSRRLQEDPNWKPLRDFSGLLTEVLARGGVQSPVFREEMERAGLRLLQDGAVLIMTGAEGPDERSAFLGSGYRLMSLFLAAEGAAILTPHECSQLVNRLDRLLRQPA